MNNNFLRNAIQNMIEIYERNIDLLKNIATKCNDPLDVELIAENSETLRSNEKLIQLNRSIMEEIISIVSKPNCAGRRTSAECDSFESADESAEVNRVVECDPQVGRTVVEEVEEKHVPNSPENPFHVEEFVNLTEQHVSFNDAVTVVNYSTPMNNMPTIESPALLAPPSTETNMTRLKRKRTLLASANVELIRNGVMDFRRKLKRTIGLCFFCGEQKTYTKLQWQKHLLSHTNENFHFCKQCELTFPQRNNHGTCSPNLFTNIYEQNRCLGENSLAAFMCNICDHVRVSESKMVEHVRTMHGHDNDCEQLYKNFTFVSNV